MERNKAAYSFVILEDTFEPDFTNEYEINKFGDLAGNFKCKNQISSKLKKLFSVNYKYEITSKSQIDEMLSSGRKDFERDKAEYKLRNLGISSGSSTIWKPFYENIQLQTVITNFHELVLVQAKNLLWSRLKVKAHIGAAHWNTFLKE